MAAGEASAIGVSPVALISAETRLAVVETKQDALKEKMQEDTSHIRESLHKINNFLQGSQKAEQANVVAIKRLEDKISHAVQQINEKVEALKNDVEALMTKVDKLESERDRQDGKWWAVARVFAAVCSLVGAGYYLHGIIWGH